MNFFWLGTRIASLTKQSVQCHLMSDPTKIPAWNSRMVDTGVGKLDALQSEANVQHTTPERVLANMREDALLLEFYQLVIGCG